MSDQPDFNQLYEIAEAQAGYFTAGQAQEAGFSWERLSYYAAAGKFTRIRRGIYRLVQFPGSPHEDLFVAWLRAGASSVISHESALYLYGLSDILPDEVHVIMPRSGSRRRGGIRLHTNQLRPDEVTRRDGLPVTIPARTIIDAAASGLPEEQVQQAVREALERGLVDVDELLSKAARRSRRVSRIIETALEREIE
jgi:predicted transcriptional regulator of viral defense system